MKKRLLLIAYYFPPLGLSGVQRVAKFAKYLPDEGWDVTVVTPSPGAYFAYDESLLSDVDRPGVFIARTRSIDPTRLAAKRAVSLPGERRRRWFSLFSQTLFQPDNKIGWYPFAVRKGRDILRQQRFDAIMSSAPPYTGHMVAGALAREFGLPLFLDYRDDWLENPRHTYPSAWHRRLSARKERRVLQTASAISVINEPIRTSILSRCEGLVDASDIFVLPHGYDPEDFRDVNTSIDTDKMEFLYSGVFYDAQRPDTFLKGLERFLAQRPEARSIISARFLGLLPADTPVLLRSLGIEDIVRHDGYVPHSEVVKAISHASVLWMTIGRRRGAEGISTGKLFEYFGSRKPILGLVPEGTARKQLEQYGASRIVSPDDVEGAAAAIGALFDLWNSRSLPVPDETFVSRHDRKLHARTLAMKLNRIVE